MAKSTPLSLAVFFLILLLLTTAPTPSHSLSDYQYGTLVSLANSLITRVANLRASRGDLSGSHRAQLIAKRLDRALELGLRGYMLSVARYYAENYSLREILNTELYGAVSDMSVLLRCLAELNQTDSDAERAAWVVGNYQTVLHTSQSLFNTLVIRPSGALTEVVGTAEREVMEGGLLRDVLELNGLIQIFNDLAPQFNSTQATQETVDGPSS